MGRPKGICAICGKGRKLTFEHLPPQCAYNERGGTQYTFSEWQDAGFPRTPHGVRGGRPVPDGTGAVTLCEICNVQLTGTKYVPHYCEWVKRCAGVLGHIEGSLAAIDAEPGCTALEVEISRISPLRIIKEIIAILLALNAEGNPQFRIRHPDLTEFVLDESRVGLSKRYRVYAVLFCGPLARFVPVSMKGNAHGRWWLTSLDHWPVAHILTVDEQEHPPLLPFGEITNFSESGPNQLAAWRGDLLVGFGHLPLPADFRTSAAIGAAAAAGEEDGVVHIDDPEALK